MEYDKVYAKHILDAIEELKKELLKTSKSNKNFGFAALWLIIIGFVLIAGSGWWFWVDDIKPYMDRQDQKIFCTEEAKQCPDGSYVSRTGPNCEFVDCPQVQPAPRTDLQRFFCADGTYYERVALDDFSITYYDKVGNFLAICERGRNYKEGLCLELSQRCQQLKIDRNE